MLSILARHCGTTPTRTVARSTLLALLALAWLALATPGPALAQGRSEARVIISTQVMEELRGQRDQYIPDLLLDRAFGIAIVPEVKKGAFGIGFRGGKGVMLVRDRQGKFSNPVFITLASASFGWQVGVQSTDLVLVFTTRAGVEGITDGKLTLGADASVAAGPVGRSASAATDATFTGAEIYSYSRSSGVFAGVALDGTVISIDGKSNADFYGQRRVGAADILSGSVTKDSESVRRLLASVGTAAGGTRAAGGAPGPAIPASTASPAASDATSAPGGEAKTFPMEDATPGQEPPR
ncbi:MAG: lipid-binding SYLF domain-containing protein [Steroidobacteraceae bacterium]|jgi:lipid-binding SYLF domain-containing protein|nr:lipid-binding SYLF domain-containing protein [Steroidobacteraceae bacterium]